MSASPRPEADGAGDGQKAARCHTTGPERSAQRMSQSTSTSASAEQESIDIAADVTQLGVFGVDCDGDLHRYHQATGTVVVTDQDNEIVQTQPGLGRERVADEWLLYVGDERGWVDHWFGAEGVVDVAGRLARALNVVQEADR